MPYALAAIDEVLLAAMADGRILHSGDRGETWEETGVRIGSVLAMAAADMSLSNGQKRAESPN